MLKFLVPLLVGDAVWNLQPVVAIRFAASAPLISATSLASGKNRRHYPSGVDDYLRCAFFKDSASRKFSLPYRDIAITLGMGWLAFMVISDALPAAPGTRRRG